MSNGGDGGESNSPSSEPLVEASTRVVVALAFRRAAPDDGLDGGGQPGWSYPPVPASRAEQPD